MPACNREWRLKVACVSSCRNSCCNSGKSVTAAIPVASYGCYLVVQYLAAGIGGIGPHDPVEASCARLPEREFEITVTGNVHDHPGAVQFPGKQAAGIAAGRVAAGVAESTIA